MSVSSSIRENPIGAGLFGLVNPCWARLKPLNQTSRTTDDPRRDNRNDEYEHFQGKGWMRLSFLDGECDGVRIAARSI